MVYLMGKEPRASADAAPSTLMATSAFSQGLTLVHFPAQLKRLLCDTGCSQGLFRGHLGVCRGVFRRCLGGVQGVVGGLRSV